MRLPVLLQFFLHFRVLCQLRIHVFYVPRHLKQHFELSFPQLGRLIDIVDCPRLLLGQVVLRGYQVFLVFELFEDRGDC